jgi:hypothetical protein
MADIDKSLPVTEKGPVEVTPEEGWWSNQLF